MKIVFYDTETSGTDPEVHDIIQIAAQVFEINGPDWKPIASFECKMMFNTANAELDALQMNCFDADVWTKEAVSQETGLKAFDHFVGPHKDVQRKRKSGGVFYSLRTGGHNILKFDDPFVRAWYREQGKFCPFDYQEMYDTLQYAKWKIGFDNPDKPENYKLGTLCEYYKVPLDGAHDAAADILANARLAWRLMQKD